METIQETPEESEEILAKVKFPGLALLEEWQDQRGFKRSEDLLLSDGSTHRIEGDRSRNSDQEK